MNLKDQVQSLFTYYEKHRPKELSDLTHLVPKAMIFPLYYYTTFCILIINASGREAWCGESWKAFNLVFIELNI